MGEPGNSLRLADAAERSQPAKDLECEPVDEHDSGRQLNRRDEYDDENKSDNADSRIEDEKRAITPAIAPLAPMVGTGLPRLVNVCTRAEATPAIK